MCLKISNLKILLQNAATECTGSSRVILPLAYLILDVGSFFLFPLVHGKLILT